MVEPGEQKGIHCRFGMRGVIAENHFDGSRNAIALLGGERRYILSHPDQCPLLSLLPKGHPSARHSAVDWSNPDLDNYPEFAMAKGNEVVMEGKEKHMVGCSTSCPSLQCLKKTSSDTHTSFDNV